MYFKHIYKLLTVSNSYVKFSWFGNIYLWKKSLFCNPQFQYDCIVSCVIQNWWWQGTTTYCSLHKEAEIQRTRIQRTSLFGGCYQQQILLQGNESPKCICHRNICSLCSVWKSVTWGVCAVQVSGVHSQRPSPTRHRKRGLAPPAVQGTGAELKSSEELFSSAMELGILIYCILTGFPFQTWFVKTMEGYIRCISWKLAAYFLAILLFWDD